MKPPKARPRAIVGIDPGVHTGLAIIDHGALDAGTRRGNGILSVATSTFFGAIDAIEELLRRYRPGELLVVIEHSKLNAAYYSRNEEKKLNGPARDRHNRNIGANHRESELLAEYCRSKEVEVSLIKPTQQKWDQRTFEAVTGFRGRSSEHGRDAARLIYGM